MITVKKIFLIVVMGLHLIIIAGCENRYQREVKLQESAHVEFVTPLIFSSKQILTVEGYSSLECPFKRNLNSSNKNYVGRLLYSNSGEYRGKSQSIRVKTNSPLTLAITLSQISEKNDSSICYYRYHAFTPMNDSKYQVRLAEDCSLTVYKASSELNSQANYVLQQTENPKCD